MNTSIGLSKPYYAKYSAGNGTPAYSDLTSMGMATEFSLAVDGKDPAILYADNGAAESVATFGGGTATLGVHKLTPETLTDLLGQAYATATGAVFKADINAPYVGIGVISMDISDGVISYTAIALYKVQCKTPDIKRVTKGESIEYQVPSLEFAVMRDDSADAKWMWMQNYATEAAALAALSAQLGGTTTTEQTTTEQTGNG